MAAGKGQKNGRLEEALATVLQTQALFQQNQVKWHTEHAELERRHNEYERLSAERFARIEALLLEHNRKIEGSRLIFPKVDQDSTNGLVLGMSFAL